MTRLNDAVEGGFDGLLYGMLPMGLAGRLYSSGREYLVAYRRRGGVAGFALLPGPWLTVGDTVRGTEGNGETERGRSEGTGV